MSLSSANDGLSDSVRLSADALFVTFYPESMESPTATKPNESGSQESCNKHAAAVLPIEVLLNVINRLGRHDLVFGALTVSRHWSSACVLVLWNKIDLSALSNTKTGVRPALLDRVRPAGAPKSPSKTVANSQNGNNAFDSVQEMDNTETGLDYGSIIRTLSARGCDVGSLKPVLAKCRAVSRLDLAGATFRTFSKNLTTLSSSPFANMAETLRSLDLSGCLLPGGRERGILDILALHSDRLEAIKIQFTNLRAMDVVDFFCGPEPEEGGDPVAAAAVFPRLTEIYLGGFRGSLSVPQGNRLALQLGPKLKSLGLFGPERALIGTFFAHAKELTTLALGANELRPLGRFAEAAQKIDAQMIAAFLAPALEESEDKQTTGASADLQPPVPPITHVALHGGYWTLPFLLALSSRLAPTLTSLFTTHFASVFRDKPGGLFARNALDGIAGMVPQLPNLKVLDVHVVRDLIPNGIKEIVSLATSSDAKLRTVRFNRALEDGSDGFGELEDGIVGLRSEALVPQLEWIEVLELPAGLFEGVEEMLAVLSPLINLRALAIRDLNKESWERMMQVFEGSRLRGDAEFARRTALDRFRRIAKERSMRLRSREAVRWLMDGLRS